METVSILIRHARIVDPSRQLDRVGDLLIGSGEIPAAGRLGPDRIPDGCRVIAVGPGAFQIRAVPSPDAVARSLPSGLKRAE